jgi:hypothetical protein
MATIYSSDLKLSIMATGENAGTWGQITNTNLYLLQQAIGGYEAISIAGGAQTTALTMSNGAISNARNAVIKLTGTITGNQVVTIPTAIEKTYIVANGTVGAFTVEFKQAGGTGVTFAAADKSTKILFADGTNIVDTGTVSETGIQTLTNKTLTSPIINTAITVNATGELRLADTDSSNYVGFKSPGTVSTNKIWTLPSADGTSGQALVTNGSATLSFADAGRTGAVNWDTTPKTTGFTAVSGNGYFVNTTSGAITVTLPSTPSAGDIVGISDYANTSATNNITVGRNSSLINGDAIDAIIKVNGQVYTLIYVDATEGWKTISQVFNQITTGEFVVATGGTITCDGDFKVHTFTGPGTFTVTAAGNAGGSNSVNYLTVAGGGGAGSGLGGGGGAGGYRTNFPSPAVAGLPVSVQGYPITVGGGGTAASPDGGGGTNGNPSVFSTITSAGGGGSIGRPGNPTGTPGGSGGGGAGLGATGGTGNSPPVSPSQGNPGGNGTPGGRRGGGGGGGAGGSGATATTDYGAGGVGSPNSISGSAVFYAGGGGGGGDSGGPAPSGAGGNGGGGQGGPSSPGTAGTPNTGGGGGGGGPGGSNGAGGGSGIVVIRYKFK